MIALPELVTRWQQNANDPGVPDAIKSELKRLSHPGSIRPQPQDVREPGIDDGFRGLGIVPST